MKNDCKQIIGAIIIALEVFALGIFGHFEGGALVISWVILLIGFLFIVSGMMRDPTGEVADQGEFKNGKYVIKDISRETHDQNGNELNPEDVSVVLTLWPEGQEGWWNTIRSYRIYNFKDPEGWETMGRSKAGDKVIIFDGKIGLVGSTS